MAKPHSPLRVALLGAGRIGQVHARAIAAAPDARLVAVADPVPGAAAALAATRGAVEMSAEAILASEAVDAVLICTPTDTHATLIEAAAAAGKPIFCEKPVDLGVERARACLARVAAAGVPLMIGFQRRFDPHFLAAKRAIEAGELGEIEHIHISSRDPAPPPMDYVARSGGIFRDQAIHDFDKARWLMGEEFVAVHATASVLIDPGFAAAGDWDTASTTLVTASGRQVQVTNGRRAPAGYDQRCEIHGSKGSLRVENMPELLTRSSSAAGFSAPPLMRFFMTRYVTAYAAEIAAFVTHVREGTAPSPSGQDGLAALVLADAATRSAATGQVVRLDPAATGLAA